MSDLAFTGFLLKITDSFCQRTTSGVVNGFVLFKRASHFLGRKIRENPSSHNTKRAEHPAVCANANRVIHSKIVISTLVKIMLLMRETWGGKGSN